MFQSKRISKKAKLKLYCAVIRPVVTYACETWALKETIINRLMAFKRKVLRKIYGPTNENGIWRIKTSQELDKIIKHKNIINFIRPQRLGWLGHIERMKETRMVKTVHSWKPISRRPVGRPKIRWEYDIRKDIQTLKVPNWKILVQDRRRRKELWVFNQLDALFFTFFNVFIFQPLHVSSDKCSSSGGNNCINESSGITHWQGDCPAC
jgi:hypothetical protein